MFCRYSRGWAVVLCKVRGARARRAPSLGTWRARPWHVRVAAREPPGHRTETGRRRRCLARRRRPASGRAVCRAVRVVPRSPPMLVAALTRPCPRAGPNGASPSAAARRLSLSVVRSGGARAARPCSGHGARGHGTSGWLPVGRPDRGWGPLGAAAASRGGAARPPAARCAGTCASCPVRRPRCWPALTRHCTWPGPNGASPSAAARRCSSRLRDLGGGRAARPCRGTWRARPWHVRVAAGEPPGSLRETLGRRCLARRRRRASGRPMRRAVRVVPRSTAARSSRANPALHQAGPQRCVAVRGDAPVPLSVYAPACVPQGICGSARPALSGLCGSVYLGAQAWPSRPSVVCACVPRGCAALPGPRRASAVFAT